MGDDKEWFCNKVEELQRSLYLLSYSILRNNEDACDAVQEAIWRAYENLDTLRDQAKLKPWLLKILSNVSLGMLRSRRGELSLDEFPDEPVSDASVDINTRMSLWDAVEKLDPAYREVVVLYYYEQFSVKEISRIMDIRPDTVKKRLSRSREKLKNLLDNSRDKETGNI